VIPAKEKHAGVQEGGQFRLHTNGWRKSLGGKKGCKEGGNRQKKESGRALPRSEKRPEKGSAKRKISQYGQSQTGASPRELVKVRIKGGKSRGNPPHPFTLVTQGERGRKGK